ncbi:WAS/WASL-interacting protein family member 3-like [Vitis riparia]|uniref:WAS/WASL-interacting protein family member 3-like n=1 Tax=Vitis riparia TaxID=96939 RepID=UPI00155AEB5E|nr:WAS/WASL-interacting protein family member 3-like [Vitis riparia]
MEGGCGGSVMESRTGEALGLLVQADGDRVLAPLVLAMAEVKRFQSVSGAPVAAPPRPASPIPPQAEQQGELPAKSVPPTPTAPSMPEATSTDPPATPPIPPATPPIFEASITISAMEFHAMIQQHLGLLPPPQTNIPRPSEPIAPVEETFRADVPPQATHKAATKPSSPPKSPAP